MRTGAYDGGRNHPGNLGRAIRDTACLVGSEQWQ